MSTKYSKHILAEAATGAFRAALQELYKVAVISNSNDDQLADIFEHSEAVAKSKEMLMAMDGSAAEDKCSNFLESLRNLPEVAWETVESNCHDNFKDICKGFKRQQELLEEKLSSDLKSWFEIKQHEKKFPEEYAKCCKEAEELEKQLLNDRIKRNKKISEYVTEGNSKKLSYSEKEFKALLPAHLKENTAERIEFLERYSSEKLSHFLKREKESEKRLEEASLKCNSELWEIIEETMKTRAFLEWLKAGNTKKLEDLKQNRSSLWDTFKEELADCRELCIKYREVDAAYVKILKEQEEKEILRERVAAAVTVQSLIRGFLVRKRYKKKLEEKKLEEKKLAEKELEKTQVEETDQPITNQE